MKHAIAAISSALLLGADWPAAARRPNILFLFAVGLGYLNIDESNPRTFYETPNIDGLATKAMRFKQDYAACPVCSPTGSGGHLHLGESRYETDTSRLQPLVE